MAPVVMVAARRFAPVVLLAILLASVLTGAAQAQLSEIANLGAHQAASRNQPVTFTADTVEYDRENSLVIAQGHVEETL